MGESSSILQFNNGMPHTVDFSSYEADCRLDPDLESFDSSLQVRTKNAINALAVDVEVRSLSFDSLKEVIGCLLENDQEVVKVILRCKNDIWKNQELSQLVEDYFENSLQTLDFCNALEKCLNKARDSQLIIQVALQHFEQEDVEEKKYLNTLMELKNFKASEDPFTEEFFQKFQLVYKQQELMLRKLQLRKKKLDKKLKSVKSWRKVSNIIFASAFAAVLIFSIMAAAMSAPPVAAALATAASIAVGSVGEWFSSLWKKYEDTLKGQKAIISSMQLGTLIVIIDLDNIRVLVDRLEMEIESLFLTADFAIKEKEAVKFGMEEIKKKIMMFTKSVEELSAQADQCGRDIGRARTVVLQRIIRHPG